jgi:HSP20 family protein
MAAQQQQQQQQQALAPWNWFSNDPVQAQQAMTPVTGMLRPFFSISRDIEDMFSSFFRNATFMTQNFANMNLTPRLDIEENENQYVILADVPGLDEKNLDIQITSDNLLTLTGERESIRESQQKRNRMHTVERSYGAFRRVLALPQDANTDRVEANYKNGVLTITVPRQQQNELQQVKHVKVNRVAAQGSAAGGAQSASQSASQSSAAAA